MPCGVFKNLPDLKELSATYNTSKLLFFLNLPAFILNNIHFNSLY